MGLGISKSRLTTRRLTDWSNTNITTSGSRSRRSGSAAVLIGPEGGFDIDERDAIRTLPQAVGVSLGPRILRADTAAAAAVSLWMAAAGDWR